MKKRNKKKIIYLCASFLMLCLILYLIWQNNSLQVTNYTISSDRLPQSFSGFRIAQISDLHNAEFGKDNDRLLNELREIQPDIIVLTGDLIDSRRTDCNIAISFARNAVQIAPTYYISGNHESRISQLDVLYKGLADAGVVLLLDDSVLLQRNDDNLLLAGIVDVTFRVKKSEKYIQKAITGLMSDNNLYTILLAHNPEYFETYVSCNPDLVLTGHIHGGQIRLPVLGGVYAPEQGFFPKYDAGLYTENQTNMIISRGLGNSIFPFRVNNRPEIVVITLENDT